MKGGDMNKRTKILRNESDQMAEEISKDGRQVLEDMLLYIRGVDISAYDQERVRRDVTQMILEGEQRGESASYVIGEDYREFCDSVLEEIPRLTAGQKVIMCIRDLCAAMSVLAFLYGGLYLALAAGYGNLNEAGPAYIEVTLGKLLQYVIIAAAATWIAHIYYRDPYKNKYKEYIRIIVSAGIVILLSLCAETALEQTLFIIHAVFLVPIAIILLIIYKLLDVRAG